jgi:hypothetical protein
LKTKVGPCTIRWHGTQLYTGDHEQKRTQLPIRIRRRGHFISPGRVRSYDASPSNKSPTAGLIASTQREQSSQRFDAVTSPHITLQESWIRFGAAISPGEGSITRFTRRWRSETTHGCFAFNRPRHRHAAHSVSKSPGWWFRPELCNAMHQWERQRLHLGGGGEQNCQGFAFVCSRPTTQPCAQHPATHHRPGGFDLKFEQPTRPSNDAASLDASHCLQAGGRQDASTPSSKTLRHPTRPCGNTSTNLVKLK